VREEGPRQLDEPDDTKKFHNHNQGGKKVGLCEPLEELGKGAFRPTFKKGSKAERRRLELLPYQKEKRARSGVNLNGEKGEFRQDLKSK